MKKTRKMIGMLVIAMLVGLFNPVGMVKGTDTAQAASTKISAKKATVTVTGTKKISMKNVHKKVKWSSSNKKIVSIKKTSGKYKKTVQIKANQTGTATIKAKVGKKTYKCKVTVKEKVLYNNPKDKDANNSINVGNSLSLMPYKITYNGKELFVSSIIINCNYNTRFNNIVLKNIKLIDKNNKQIAYAENFATNLNINPRTYDYYNFKFRAGEFNISGMNFDNVSSDYNFTFNY